MARSATCSAARTSFSDAPTGPQRSATPGRQAEFAPLGMQEDGASQPRLAQCLCLRVHGCNSARAIAPPTARVRVGARGPSPPIGRGLPSTRTGRFKRERARRGAAPGRAKLVSRRRLRKGRGGQPSCARHGQPGAAVPTGSVSSRRVLLCAAQAALYRATLCATEHVRSGRF